MKKIYLYFIAFMLVLSFSSCAITEVNEKAIIEGVFVNESGGQLEYTFAVPLYEEEEITQEYITVTGGNFETAFEALEKVTAKKPFPGQNKYVIFSDNLNSEQVKGVLKDMSADYEWRKDCVFFFADDKAFDYIREEKITSEHIVDFIEIYNAKNRKKTTGLFKAEKAAKEELYEYIFPVFTIEEEGLSEKGTRTI